jgi:hypothetical protein
MNKTGAEITLSAGLLYFIDSELNNLHNKVAFFTLLKQ